jgi:ribosomal protein S18 acetylase RimI-like enzyme
MIFYLFSNTNKQKKRKVNKMKEDHHSILWKGYWLALTGPQAAYADKCGCASVYKEEYGSFGALSEYTEKAYQTLASIVRPGRIVIILGNGHPIEYPEWKQLDTVSGHVMLLETSIEVPDLDYVKLSKSDAAEMMELAKVTGLSSDFASRIIEIGDYYGIKKDNRLVAMAGERLKLDGYTEVSGVCTHPDYRTRGYGRGLTALVSHRIQEKGDIPFLQVKEENVGAIRIYEKMGFKKYASSYMDVLLRTDVNP